MFTQIFLYQKFTSISLNVLATMASYTGIMIGFCVPGFLASIWRLNIKHGFMWSFAVMGASIFYLLHITDISHAYLAMFLWGMGQGIFWLTVNTFELTETIDNERDYYSSVLNAGNQILSLVGPALAALLIWISGNVLGLGTYTLLFTIAPAIFLLGFFCFSDIRDYRPESLHWADVVHYFTDRQNQFAQIYTMGTGFQHILGTTVPALAILSILGSALRIGIYNTFFAVFSAICILVVAQYRTPANRITIYGVTTIGVVASILWFGYALDFAALIIYTVVGSILKPLLNISSHVIDLGAMEIGRRESDFYATMLLRDLLLWFWRCVGGSAFLMLISILGVKENSISVGLYLLAGAFLLTYFGAFFFLKSRTTVASPA